MPTQFRLPFAQHSRRNPILSQELLAVRGQLPYLAQDLQLALYHNQGTMLPTPAGTTFQNSVSASQSIFILFKNSLINQD
jgi:hypothetical protein